MTEQATAKGMNKHQTAVAAEAFAAGQFARAGYSVFVQYGANQPGYDLVVSDKNEGVDLRINVKGSTNGGWLLAGIEKARKAKEAISEWLETNRRLAFCFVQFQGRSFDRLPEIWLATGEEVGIQLQSHWFGKEPSPTLWEKYEPKRGPYKGQKMGLPASWLMNELRIHDVMKRHAKSYLG
jgi:hypothetical protein